MSNYDYIIVGSGIFGATCARDLTDAGKRVLVLERDGKPERTFVVQSGTHQSWHWLEVTGADGIDLAAGECRLVARNREDGARLSAVLFATKRYGLFKPETPEGD